MQLDFHNVKGPFNDTYRWDVTSDKQITVRELLTFISEERKDEWGSLRAYEPILFCNSKTLCEYKHGEMRVIDQILFDEYMDKPVRAIKACGGYTRMDYTVTTTVAAEQLDEIDKLIHDLQEARESLDCATHSLTQAQKEITDLKFEVKSFRKAYNTERSRNKALLERSLLQRIKNIIPYNALF